MLWALIKDYARVLPSSCGTIVYGLFTLPICLDVRRCLLRTSCLIHTCYHLVYRARSFRTKWYYDLHKCASLMSVRNAPVSFRDRVLSPYKQQISIYQVGMYLENYTVPFLG